MAELAIATPQFHVSETFVIDHIRTIAPGSTVVISADHPDAALPPGVPFICDRIGWRGLAGRTARRLAPLRPPLAQIDDARHAAFLRKYGIKAILAEYLTFACRFVRPAARAGIPLYVYAHGFDVAAGFRDAKLNRNYQALFAGAAGVIVASRFMRDKVGLLGCPPAKLQIIPCGIDPASFAPTSRELGRVLAVGRLVEKKAPQLTLQAFARVLEEHPSARLDLVGEGPLRAACENVIIKCGMAHAVTIHGARPPADVRGLLRRAAIFVQHSVTAANGDTEGLGVSLLEAMASEMPVVTTRHNGFVDTVADGETGLLVEEHDVEGMARAILELLGDPARAITMGKAGRRRVEEHFALDESARKLRRAMLLDPIDINTSTMDALAQ